MAAKPTATSAFDRGSGNESRGESGVGRRGESRGSGKRGIQFEQTRHKKNKLV